MADANHSKKRRKQVFEFIELLGTEVAHWITFVLLFVLNPGHSLSEVRKTALIGAAEDESGVDGLLPEDASPDIVLAFAEESRRAFDAEGKRHEDVDEKSRVLLTVATVVLAVNAALLASLPIPKLGLVPLSFLLGAVFLLLRYLRTGEYRVVDLSEVDWAQLVTVRKQIAVQELECAADWAQRIGFLVGIQRAAYRALLIAVAFDVALVGFIVLAGAEPELVGDDNVVTSLHISPSGPAVEQLASPDTVPPQSSSAGLKISAIPGDSIVSGEPDTGRASSGPDSSNGVEAIVPNLNSAARPDSI